MTGNNDDTIYEAEQSLKTEVNKDCPICRGDGCPHCYNKGTMQCWILKKSEKKHIFDRTSAPQVDSSHDQHLDNIQTRAGIKKL